MVSGEVYVEKLKARPLCACVCVCVCVCKQLLMHCEEGHCGCFWRKANRWLTSLVWKQASSGAPKSRALYHDL